MTPPGSFLLRFLAAAFDFAAILVASILVFHFVGPHLLFLGPAAKLPWMLLILIFLAACYGEWGKGRTLGGLLLNIRVTDQTGGVPAWWEAALRAAVFTLWTFAWILPESLSVLWPPAGLPIFAQALHSFFLSMIAGSVIVVPWDAERRSPFDLFSNTRITGPPDPLAGPVESNRRLPASTLCLLYVLLTVGICAGLERAALRNADVLPITIPQSLQVLRWFRSHSTLIATQVSAAQVERSGFQMGEKVPTLRVSVWVPPNLLDSAKSRDTEIYSAEYDLKKNPEITRGFLQLELDLFTDSATLPFLGRRRIPFYTDLPADAAAARYYLEHPQVAASTVTVTSRYALEPSAPKGWKDRLYVKKDFAGVAKAIQEQTTKANDLGASLASRWMTTLATPKDAKDYGHRKLVLDEWIAQEPRAALPLVLRGELQEHYAWILRGGNFAEYVDKTQWAAFFEQMHRADEDFKKAELLDPHDPYSWALSIDAARALQLPHVEEERRYREAVKRAPWMLEARNSYMHGLSPQWGGSLDQMKRFAADCEKMADRYPLVGLAELEPIDFVAYTSKDKAAVYGSAENWPIIARVYGRMIKRYPEMARFSAQFAWYAYSAQKYEVASEQFDRLGDHFYENTYWTDVSYYNVCRAYSYNQKGWIYLQRNDLDTGMPWLLKALELNAFDTWPMAKLATCYQRKNDIPKAEHWARRTLENSPPPLDAAEAQGVVAWAEQQAKSKPVR